jgi:hypothetical protein
MCILCVSPVLYFGDEDYEIGIEWVPLDGFEAAIADGRLNDARVVAGLYLACGFLAVQAT